MLRLFGIAIFGMAFGFVESAVVFYLRQLLGDGFGLAETSYREVLNLGVIAFVSPDAPALGSLRLQTVETAREAATIAMLAAIAYVSGRGPKEWIGSFLVAFAVWDLSYYAFLRVLSGWPSSLLDLDVYFLIPVPWVGPVVTPVVASTLLLMLGVRLYVHK